MGFLIKKKKNLKSIGEHLNIYLQKLSTQSPKVGLALQNSNTLFHRKITKENHGPTHLPWN